MSGAHLGVRRRAPGGSLSCCPLYLKWAQVAWKQLFPL